MTKIAFFDVDGTMINVPHQLLKPTDKTIHALKKISKTRKLYCCSKCSWR